MNRKLGFRRCPSDRRILPLHTDVAQGQSDEFGGGFVIREVTFITDALAHATVQTLNGVGGVNHLAYGGCEREERMIASQFRRQLCATVGKRSSQGPLSNSLSACSAAVMRRYADG